MPPELPPLLVLYDGSCGFCNAVVRSLLRSDPSGKLFYAPLQGETADYLRSLHPRIPQQAASFVFYEHKQVYLRSQAFERLSRHLPYPWRFGTWLKVVPRFVADLAYRLFARIRYRVFGKYESCPVPEQNVRDRFLP